MLKSEMMSKWEPWGDILRAREEAGERRLDPKPDGIVAILTRSRTRRTVDQIKDELFRILTGGEAQSAIVQGMTRDVFDVSGRLVSKGKSRTKAVVRELRQKINAPRRANDIGDYDSAVAEWDSNVAKLISHQGQDTLPAQEDFLEAYYNILPTEILTFAEMKFDESFGLLAVGKKRKSTPTETKGKTKVLNLHSQTY